MAASATKGNLKSRHYSSDNAVLVRGKTVSKGVDKVGQPNKDASAVQGNGRSWGAWLGGLNPWQAKGKEAIDQRAGNSMETRQSAPPDLNDRNQMRIALQKLGRYVAVIDEVPMYSAMGDALTAFLTVANDPTKNESLVNRFRQTVQHLQDTAEGIVTSCPTLGDSLGCAVDAVQRHAFRGRNRKQSKAKQPAKELREVAKRILQLGAVVEDERVFPPLVGALRAVVQPLDTLAPQDILHSLPGAIGQVDAFGKTAAACLGVSYEPVDPVSFPGVDIDKAVKWLADAKTKLQGMLNALAAK